MQQLKNAEEWLPQYSFLPAEDRLRVRNWVYAHIPPGTLERKKRDYFSREEIESVQRRLREKPELFVYWNKHVPLNLQEIVGDVR